MATKSEWSSAIEGLWEGFLRGDGGVAVLRWAVLVVLAVGFLWSSSLFIEMTGLSETSSPVHALNAELDAPAFDLSELTEEARSLFLARMSEPSLVDMPARRYPFASVIEEKNPTFGDVIDYEAFAYRELHYGEPMPPVTVKGVTVMGNKTLALISIGDDEGILAEAGYSFGGGKGRIESISLDRITVLWMGDRREIYIKP